MPKNQSVAILSFSFFFSAIAFASSLLDPLLAKANYPVVPSSDLDVPVCYMDTADGRRLDMGALCGPQPEAGSKPAPSCRENLGSAAAMEIGRVNYQGNVLTGRVTNQSCETIENIRVNYRVMDEEGNQIDNGFIYARPSTVAPGETAEFRGTIASGADVEVTHADR